MSKVLNFNVYVKVPSPDPAAVLQRGRAALLRRLDVIGWPWSRELSARLDTVDHALEEHGGGGDGRRE